MICSMVKLWRWCLWWKNATLIQPVSIITRTRLKYNKFKSSVIILSFSPNLFFFFHSFLLLLLWRDCWSFHYIKVCFHWESNDVVKTSFLHHDWIYNSIPIIILSLGFPFLIVLSSRYSESFKERLAEMIDKNNLKTVYENVLMILIHKWRNCTLVK